MMLLWIPQAVLIVTATIVDGDQGRDLPLFLILMVSSLLGVACYSLFKMEVHNRTRAVFLNLGLFFETNALMRPIWTVLNSWLFRWNDPNNYMYQYQGLLYYLLLSISVIYLVLDRVPQWHRISVKYLVTFLIAVGGWVVIYYPYLGNPDYLKNTPEIADYKNVRDAIANLKKAGITEPSAAEIVNFAQLQLIGDVKANGGSSLEGKIKRVSDILPYTQGLDYGTLYWKPLYMDSIWISLLCTLFLVGSMVFKYFNDPPEGAYVEKFIWCLLVFCAFELLHMYAYTQTTRWEVLLGVIHLGRYVSLVIMLILLFLFAVRLRFVHSIEGSYYERRLLSDASRITRWRDAFDNWILKQFMNPAELDRRFLTQRRTQE
jgi:hypothetical protein